MKQFSVHDKDFKPKTSHAKPGKFKLNQMQWIALCAGITLPVLLISVLSAKTETEAPKTQAAAISDSSNTRVKTQLMLPDLNKTTLPDIAEVSLPEITTKTQNVTVKSGDTLTHIFRRVGLNARQVYQITQFDKKAKALSRLAPGQTFDFNISEDKKLESLTYHIDKTHTLVIQKKNDKFEAINVNREYETRITSANASINTSLFDAAQKAGMRDSLTMDLAYIFGWDIDFALDIRDGDQFVVMYEELYLDGEFVRNGNILAAEFVNQGKSYKAVRYTDVDNNSNFYSEDGSSMRKAFLRSPVDFTRISSRFGKRYHPTLKKRKSHKGVDYAASRGTPIKAAGDGKIVWRARKGGYGKTVMIKHGSRYTTLYAHMSNYNRKAKRGSYVKQGQVIGYVGTTGRSTGPHLHYEFRVNGSHRNPLTVKLPNAASIKKKYRSDFLAKSRPLIAQLNLMKNTNVATNDF